MGEFTFRAGAGSTEGHLSPEFIATSAVGCPVAAELSPDRLTSAAGRSWFAGQRAGCDAAGSRMTCDQQRASRSGRRRPRDPVGADGVRRPLENRGRRPRLSHRAPDPPRRSRRARGFGLRLVHHMSSAWGVVREAAGPTRVWCDPPLDRVRASYQFGSCATPSRSRRASQRDRRAPRN
jgi:hypothetical protein